LPPEDNAGEDISAPDEALGKGGGYPQIDEFPGSAQKNNHPEEARSASLPLGSPHEVEEVDAFARRPQVGGARGPILESLRRKDSFTKTSPLPANPATLLIQIGFAFPRCFLEGRSLMRSGKSPVLSQIPGEGRDA